MASKRKKQSFLKALQGKTSYWFARFIKPALFRIIIFALLIWLGTWLWLGGYIRQSYGMVQNSFYNLTAEQGLRIENVMIEGRIHTDLDLLNAILNTEKGDPILGFNSVAAQKQIEDISWVKEARIERHLPNTLYVFLEERQPVAIWRGNDGYNVIDVSGYILTRKNAHSYGNFIILHGNTAPERAEELLSLLNAERGLEKHVKEAYLMKARRWDLVPDNGIRVNLPEFDDMPVAISVLARAQNEQNLFARQIKRIDVRQPDRMILQTARGKIEDLLPTLDK